MSLPFFNGKKGSDQICNVEKDYFFWVIWITATTGLDDSI